MSEFQKILFQQCPLIEFKKTTLHYIVKLQTFNRVPPI